MMDGFKTCDAEKINGYYSMDAVTSYIDEADGENYQEAILKTLGKMDYNINSVLKSGDNAVVINCDITTVDFSSIIKSFIEKIMDKTNSVEYKTAIKTMPEEDYKSMLAKFMIEAVEASDGVKTTKNINVTMIKSDSKWVLGGDSELLMKVLFGDIHTAVESLT